MPFANVRCSRLELTFGLLQPEVITVLGQQTLVETVNP
jgi:hypothetical protein